jgi:DnaK suppressor protein
MELRTELTADIKKHRDEIYKVDEPEACDQVLAETERDLAIGGMERKSRTLSLIKAALNRIDEGTYGTCELCEEPISTNRLKAIPWASCCIKCQQATEENNSLWSQSIPALADAEAV